MDDMFGTTRGEHTRRMAQKGRPLRPSLVAEPAGHVREIGVTIHGC